MMEDEEFVALFKEAEEQGFITDLENYAECASECDECPAVKACLNLSDAGEDFIAFKTNFDRRIRCLI